MNRRLFIGQAVAGLVLQSIPTALTARPLFSHPINPAAASHQLMSPVAEAVQHGLIGAVEQIRIIQNYSPAQTTLATIKELAHRSLQQAGQWTGLPVTASQLVFAESPSAAYGSYTGSFTARGVTVTWQLLARIGGEPGPATGQVQIYGSAGVLHLDDQRSGYRILGLDGYPIHSFINPSSLL